MSVREMVTQMDAILAFQADVSTDTTTNTTIIDTADYDLGLSFFLSAPAYTDGTYKLVFQEGEESDLSDAVTVSSDKIVPIYVSSKDAVNTGITAITADGNFLVKAGLHSTKRYVRAQIVSTGTDTGATLNLVAVVGAEVCPQ
jgi:hypothetical protein